MKKLANWLGVNPCGILFNQASALDCWLGLRPVSALGLNRLQSAYARWLSVMFVFWLAGLNIWVASQAASAYKVEALLGPNY